jgi:hypothetical protein
MLKLVHSEYMLKLVQAETLSVLTVLDYNRVYGLGKICTNISVIQAPTGSPGVARGGEPRSGQEHSGVSGAPRGHAGWGQRLSNCWSWRQILSDSIRRGGTGDSYQGADAESAQSARRCKLVAVVVVAVGVCLLYLVCMTRSNTESNSQSSFGSHAFLPFPLPFPPLSVAQLLLYLPPLVLIVVFFLWFWVRRRVYSYCNLDLSGCEQYVSGLGRYVMGSESSDSGSRSHQVLFEASPSENEQLELLNPAGPQNVRNAPQDPLGRLSSRNSLYGSADTSDSNHHNTTFHGTTDASNNHTNTNANSNMTVTNDRTEPRGISWLHLLLDVSCSGLTVAFLLSWATIVVLYLWIILESPNFVLFFAALEGVVF